MDQVFPMLTLIIVTGICLIALFMTLHAFFYRILERTRSIATERASRSFLAGLVNALFFVAITVALLAVGQSTGGGVFFVLAFVIALLLLVGVLFGTTAMVLLLRERLFPGQLGNRPMVWAGGIATLACLTPYLGWFGLFPYMIFRGLGAFVITLVEFWRERRDAEANEEVNEVE